MPYASAALSPRCNLIAAIGDLSDGLGVRYFLHLYALPSFSLITSQVFENNIDSPATVEFSADGGALVVRDEQMLHSWAVGDNPHDGIRKIGVYRSPNGIAGRCATSAHVFLTQESDPDLGEVVTYTWLALSPKAEIRPLDLANYDLVTGF
jgi:hypothetical protein